MILVTLLCLIVSTADNDLMIHLIYHLFCSGATSNCAQDLLLALHLQSLLVQLVLLLESILVVLKGYMVCKGLNSKQSHARQVPYPLYCFSSSMSEIGQYISFNFWLTLVGILSSISWSTYLDLVARIVPRPLILWALLG